jgi:benzil reductase ((S)-benzoin forming)
MEKRYLFIVTGATKGLGKAIAEEILEMDNAEVIGTGSTEASIFHAHYKHIKVDFSQVAQVVSQLDEIIPTLDFSNIVLINNAGWIGEIAPLGRQSSGNIERIMTINWIVPAILMNHFVGIYASKKDSERMVINISSGAAEKSIDGWSGYCASKAALNRLTQVAQEESFIQDTGIKFFSIAPGVVDTDMQAVIRNAHSSDFSALNHFIQLKEEGGLQSSKATAEKILKLILSPPKSNSVVLDIRNFD